MSQSPVLTATSKDAEVSGLLDLSVRGLHRMFNVDTGIFCDRLVREGEDWKQVGVSPRYSLMSYLGLHRAELSGLKTGFDVSGLTRRIARDLDWLTNLGDLGCLLWAASEIVPGEVPGLWPRLDIDTALERYQDGRTGSTMEIAWLLTGLASAKAIGTELPNLERATDKAFARLMENRGESGLFGHLSRAAGMQGKIRGHIGSFADQVYPTIALSLLSTSFGRKDALEAAVSTAKKVCGLQGPLGQWWWHYNSDTGIVVSTYPVYSVHQHAMGPMMLFAAMNASGEDFRPNIYKGLEWIRTNELGMDMREMTAPLVWRAIAQTTAGKWKTRLKATLKRESPINGFPGKLSLVPECRPYELGWMLYGFAPEIIKCN